MSRRTATFASLLSLALITGLVTYLWLHRPSSRPTKRAELAEVLGPCRLLEGRLTGGFAYAPYDPSHPARPLTRDRRIALRKILQRISGDTPQAIADRALVRLIDGNPRQAVEGLERAVAAQPASAALLSDLSAAYLADAQANGDAYSRVKALEAAENAVSIDPKLPEARFNRALALDRLFLRNQARSAWDDYPRLDPKSGWGREARARRQALVGPDAASRWAVQVRSLEAAVSRNDPAAVRRIVDRFPQAAREYAEEKLFGDWAKAELAKRSEEAKRSLDTARAIGAALVAANGERMVADTVETIDRAASSRDSSRFDLLTAGHASYQEGLQSYGGGRFTEARDRFTRAHDLLDRGKSPFVQWSIFRFAVCEMQLFHYGRALVSLNGLLANRMRFRSLKGRAFWVKGLIDGIQARPMESLAEYRLALSDFEALQESENVALVRSLTAECLTNLGDLPAAWKFYLDSMSLMGNLRDPLRRQEFLETGSESALREDKPATALVFMREALGDSYAPTVESFYCLRWRVLAHCRLRQWEEARKDLREARLLVAKYTDNAAQESLRGDLLSMEGEVLKQESPAASLVHLNQAIKTYESTSYRQQLALLHAERARSYLALNQETAAERDFDLAIQALQRQRSAVSDDNLRALFLDEFRGIFDDMVALQARLGRKGLALDYAESTKAQVLRELMTSAESDRQHPPLKNEEVQKNLPRNVAVVEYSVLPKSLLTWVIRRSSLSLVKTDITAEEVQSLVEDFRGKILRRSAAQYRDARSRDLSQLLIGKIRGSIQGVNHLVLVPDRRLYEVPFAALPDRGSSKYLVESYSLSIAPSVNTYLDALERERVLGRSQALKILVLGNPTLDPLLAPNLPSLSYSEREARNVKGLYPDARLLLGRDATRFSFLEGLARFDVVHFAGHSAAFPAAPLSSFLAFAPGPNDSGILYSRDLFQARGVRAQVVILSSCESLSSDGRSGEGVASLARALLSSGVPVVVGSLWSIDDQKSEKLLVLFHRYFRSGHSAVDALRRAQLDLLSTPDTAPVHWAGFQLIGANARCSLDRERIGDE